MSPDLPDNVINQQPSLVIANLMGVMEHIITEGEEEAYTETLEDRNNEYTFINNSYPYIALNEHNYISI